MPDHQHTQEGLPPLPPGALFVGRETDKVGESPTRAVVPLPAGTEDDVLTVVDGAPAWSPPSGGSDVQPWATGTDYTQYQVVVHSGLLYQAVDAHTAGATFAGDSAHWTQLDAETDALAIAQLGTHAALTTGAHGLAALLAAKQSTSEKGAASGYAALGSDGLIPPANLLVTRRVTRPLHAGAGGSAAGAGSFRDLLMRTLVALPVTTTRWRIRCRNYDVKNNVAGAGQYTCTGVYIGLPSFTGDRWAGAFTAAPTSALGSFVLSDDAVADTSSGWVTDPALQFTSGKLHALSLGFTGDADVTMRYSTLTQGILYQASGAAATVGNSAAPASDESYMAFDLRLEYEYLADPSQPVIVCLGDSQTGGSAGNDEGPYQHETWPGAASLRHGVPFINLGVNGTASTDWVTNIGTSQRWTRCDLTTTPPDVAILLFGRNELGGLATYMSTNFPAIRDYLRNTIGVKRIFMGTVIPSALTSTNETNRQLWNDSIRAVPRGASGVIDFDRALVDFATDSICYTDYMPSGAEPHPNRGGYQRMAEVVPPFAWRSA